MRYRQARNERTNRGVVYTGKHTYLGYSHFKEALKNPELTKLVRHAGRLPSPSVN